MKINQIIVESEPVDEAGEGVGKVLGKAANALGGLAGGVAGAWDAGKAGFDSGKGFVSGQRVNTPRSPYYAGGSASAPAAGSSSRVDLNTLDDTQLNNLRKQIDTVIRTRSAAPAGGGPAPAGGSTPSASPGGAPAAPAGGSTPSASPGGAPAPASSPEKGKVYKGSDGKAYKWLGNQWLDTTTNQPAPKAVQQAMTQHIKSGQAEETTVAPRKGQTVAGSDGQAYTWKGAAWVNAANQRIAPKEIGASLTRSVADGSAKSAAIPKKPAPAAAPTAAPKPAAAAAPKPTAAPSATPRPSAAPATTAPAAAPKPTAAPLKSAPFGNYKPTGNEPPAVKTGQKAPVNNTRPADDQLPPSRPAASRTDYDWVAGGGVGPNTRLSDVGAVGRRKPTNEGFYSKFLGKEI